MIINDFLLGKLNHFFNEENKINMSEIRKKMANNRKKRKNKF